MVILEDGCSIAVFTGLQTVKSVLKKARTHLIKCVSVSTYCGWITWKPRMCTCTQFHNDWDSENTTMHTKFYSIVSETKCKCSFLLLYSHSVCLEPGKYYASDPAYISTNWKTKMIPSINMEMYASPQEDMLHIYFRFFPGEPFLVDFRQWRYSCRTYN